MSIEADDEILQDFLVEAGEILDSLGSMLVELEQRPQDADLLNTIFRGFHTIKGGAGFLNLNAMVAICHQAEDVFNVLRQGERPIDAGLMDAVFRALDVVKEQFQQLEDGVDLVAADGELLDLLGRYAAPDELTALDASLGKAVLAPIGAAPEAPDDSRECGSGEFPDVTDAEFAELLDIASSADVACSAEGAGFAAVEHGGNSDGDASDGDSDEMSAEDFERLLDQLHGGGKAPASTPAKVPDLPAPGGPAAGAARAADLPPADVSQQAARNNAETTVRVDTGRLDQIMNMVGELVLVRNRLTTLKSGIADEAVSAAIATLELVTSDIQTAVMKTRMQPIKKVFSRFPRVVRDLARSLAKEVDLELHGEDTDLDKNLVEALADPLVHLVRNSIDHGIEIPAERERAGKSPVGKVVLSAKQEGDHIQLVISDDGAGMDADVLRAKAVEKGLMDADAAARLTEADAFCLIFKPGFSTKAAISDISGRGVGMDVVKTRIDQLNGSIEIASVKGAGTRLSIKLPLTLAILPTLMVGVGNHIFALPLSSVSEIFQFADCKTTVVDNRPCVVVREKVIPLLDLRHWLARDSDGQFGMGSEQVVIAHLGAQRIGLITNRVLGQEEVVIKPLGTLLRGLPGFAGATITGDGGVALILDIPSLVKSRAGLGGMGSLSAASGPTADSARQDAMALVS
ncbi:MAG: chemotaxis protein CheA [Porticoccaceae bacterium]